MFARKIFLAMIIAGGLVYAMPDNVVYLGDGSTTPVVEVEVIDRVESPAPEFRRTAIEKPVIEPMESADTVDIRVAIRPGEALQVEIDASTGIFNIIPPNHGLSGTCSSAVQSAPEWIREKLALQLPHFGSKADSIANEILSASADIVDEVAFVAANLAPETVADPRFEADIITENAEWIYRLADSLAYVELVEDATPGNERTTTRYRCVDLSADPPDTVWMDAPHEVYYWWVVHPVLTDEILKRRDDGTETQQQTYGHLWREYLWADPDPTFPYTAGGYPLLADYMLPCRFLWCRRDTMLTGMRDRTDDDGALNALGNWTFRVVPNPPVSPRGLQPNQIAFNHGGNCGEIQDLMAAAGRTALIPSPGTVDPLEDHVWNEFFDNGYEDTSSTLGWAGFPASQVNRWDYDGHTYLAPRWAGYDSQRGGSKDVSFVYDYRGDGTVYNRIDQYSSSCSLSIYVRDAHNDPVDGVTIWLCSDSPYGSGIYLGCSAVTGSDGYARFAAGENNPYYGKAVCSLGEDPGPGYVSEIVSMAGVDGSYSITLNLDGSLPQLEIAPAGEPADTIDRGIIVEWEVVGEIARGKNLRTSQELTCSDYRPGGRITSALFDSAQAQNWQDSTTALAWLYQDRILADTSTFMFPDSGKYTFILSNQQALTNDQIVELRFIGINMTTAVEEFSAKPEAFEISAWPNPFNSAVTIAISGVGAIHELPLRVEIYDVAGRRVSTLRPSATSLEKGGTDVAPLHKGGQEGSYIWRPAPTLPSGVYLVRARFDGQCSVKRVVYLK